MSDGMQDATMNIGVMNALRTGNMMVDMMTCMMVPMIMKAMINVMGVILPVVLEFLFSFRPKDGKMYVRKIDLTKRNSRWEAEVVGKCEKNELLQKAIQLYIGSLDLKYDKADCALKTVQTLDPWAMHGNTYDQLQEYRILRLPTENDWVKVAPDVEYMFCTSFDEEKEDDKEKGREPSNTMKCVFTFRSRKSEAAIDKFIEKAFDYYKEEMKKLTDTGRYMYNLKSSSGKASEDGDAPSAPEYRRYKLSGEKTFGTWFSPEKTALLKLIDSFMKKEGKFAISGFPYKLGLLLHGPPGTGKTSLIKCLAEYTGRHIVNIPLARIKTNQELMDLVYDLRFSVAGEDLPIQLNFEQIVFVMEDIDCASDIVHTRTKKAPRDEDKAADMNLLTREMTEEHTSFNLDDGGSPRVKPVEMPDEKDHKDDDGDDDDDEKKKKKDKWEMLGLKGSYAIKDKLNLSGLLNVLDGVVDTPGRILVMTTNHPEKLDPALIRPGRVNKRVYLSYMHRESIKEIAEHYFPGEKVTKEDLALIPDQRFTPAEVEQFCAECDTIKDLIKMLLEAVSRSGNDPKFLSTAQLYRPNA
eukprot:TRINITY_DN32524_c0_g1_i1.p1 TRINITY_DN32524_c0_g1~~TRINITY_DN32524_c0_g1_i1.p1  ORF type:complete len:581 (+),score=257.93 TRINITY_DN32524_c0_g1_i1:72-1814(+)